MASQLSAPSPNGRAHLIVDIQWGMLKKTQRPDGSFDGLSDIAQAVYLAKLAAHLADARQHNEPVIWAVMNSACRFHHPVENRETYDVATLRDMKFLPRTAPSGNEYAAYSSFEQWIANNGPRHDEAITEKIDLDAFREKQLPELLRQKEVKELTVVGTSAENCVFASARGGAKTGFRTLLLTDLIVGEADPEHAKASSQIESRLRKMLIESPHGQSLVNSVGFASYSDLGALREFERDKNSTGRYGKLSTVTKTDPPVRGTKTLQPRKGAPDTRP